MALTEKNASRYNLKRAAAFAAAGINSADIAYAHPGFKGYGEATCCLCGKQHIKWLFILRFDAPSAIDALAGVAKDIFRGEAIVMEPVGSECIQSWFDALPESQEKLDALARWQKELDKLSAAKREKAIESVVVKAAGSVEALAARFKAVEDVIKALPLAAKAFETLSWTERRAFRDFSYRLNSPSRTTFRAKLQSVKAAKYAIDLLVRVEAALSPVPVAVEPVVPSWCGVTGDMDDEDEAAEAAEAINTVNAMFAETQPFKAPFKAFVLSPDGKTIAETEILDLSAFEVADEPTAAPEPQRTADELLLDVALDVIDSPTQLARLSPWEQTTIKDIAAKVARYGTFASSKQRGFLSSLVKTANGDKAPEEIEAEKLAVATVQPGDASYVSPSGILGARY